MHEVNQGRHRRIGRGVRTATVLILLAGIPVLTLAGGAVAGYRYDRARAERILPGVSIAGIDVGGMTRAQAEQALAGVADDIVSRPIVVRAAGKKWNTTTGALGTKVDVATAIGQALAVSDSFGWASRLYHRLLHKSVHRSFDVGVAYDKKSVGRFVAKVSAKVHTEARDASRDFTGGQLVVERSKPGRLLNSKSSYSALMTAVRGDDSSVKFTTRAVTPEVTEDDLGMLIVVRISQNRLYLYDGFKLVRSYPVATGQLGIYPTPQGHFQVINKRINPTWVNPAKDTWGKGEPDFIPPGPDNPLGTRALDLSAPGIRIHGTPNDASIGHYASHGCIRMHIPDSEDLYPRVSIGNPVIITS
jgi:lipoprotein-anchoring transpeptidase ErfK/SrfK